MPQMALGTVRWAAEGKFGSQSAQAARTAPSLASVSATAQVHGGPCSSVPVCCAQQQGHFRFLQSATG